MTWGGLIAVLLHVVVVGLAQAAEWQNGSSRSKAAPYLTPTTIARWQIAMEVPSRLVAHLFKCVGAQHGAVEHPLVRGRILEPR